MHFKLFLWECLLALLNIDFMLFYFTFYHFIHVRIHLRVHGVFGLPYNGWKVSKYGVISGLIKGKYGPEITSYLDAFLAV